MIMVRRGFMLKRVTSVFLVMCSAITMLFVASKNSVGKSSISLEEPGVFKISLMIIVGLFLVPLILSFFSNSVIKMMNIAYQSIIVLTFLGLIPIGFMIPNGITTIIVSVLGTLMSIISIVVLVLDKTIRSSRNRNARTSYY